MSAGKLSSDAALDTKLCLQGLYQRFFGQRALLGDISPEFRRQIFKPRKMIVRSDYSIFQLPERRNGVMLAGTLIKVRYELFHDAGEVLRLPIDRLQKAFSFRACKFGDRRQYLGA